MFFPFAMLLQCVEIEFLATLGSKWGCQPFGCPCSQDVTHCQKVSFSRYLPFVKSKSPLPTRSLRSLRAAAHSTSSALCLHHAHPFVAAAEKHLSHAEKQRVWSRSCGVQDFLQIWSRSQLWHETAANQRTLVEIELLAMPAFQLPMFGKCDSLPKRDLFDCLSNKESMPSVKSKPPLPTRSLRSLRAAAHSNSSGLCLHHAHPFVAAAEKHLSHAEKQRVWSRSCGVQDFLQYCDCALSCGMRLLQTNEHLSRLSF